jgi:DNA-binding MarR family transcriptional regulator
MKKVANVNLFELRKEIHRQEEKFGVSNMNNPEKAIFAYIAQGESTITKIQKDDYFKDYSISTIKRAIINLSIRGVITSRIGKCDKRERILSLNL